MDTLSLKCNRHNDMFYATRLYEGDDIIIKVFYNKEDCRNYVSDTNYELEHPDVYPKEEEPNEQEIQYERDDARTG